MRSLRRPRQVLQSSRSPLFLVGTPGAGVGALYEVLGATRSLALLDEAGNTALQAFFADLHGPSETLTSEQATPAATQRLHDLLSGHVSARGTHRRLVAGGHGYARRIAFLAKAFPEAQFIFLHRAPHAAADARRWTRTTQQVLRDLQALPDHRWCAVSYDALLADPADEAYWLGQFAGVPRRTYVAGPLVRHHQAQARSLQPLAPLSLAAARVNQEALRLVERRHPSWTSLGRDHVAAAPRPVLGRRLAASLCLGAAALPSVANAATFMVSNLNDSGSGSLRDAVAQANAAGGSNSIIFGTGATGMLALSGGNILITSALQITGPGPESLTIDANDASRIFYAKGYVGNAGNANVIISGMTLQHGGQAQNGGAIFANNVNLWLDNVVVQDSNANYGGGVLSGGNGNQTLAITNSTISHNTAASNGGGVVVAQNANALIYASVIEDNASRGAHVAYDGGAGMSLYHVANVNIIGTTVTGNIADDGAGGVGIRATQATIDSTTIAGNTGDVSAMMSLLGRPPGVGGLGLFFTCTATVTNSTISDNSDNRGVGGVFVLETTASFVNTTVANNAAPYNPGIYAEGSTMDLDFCTIVGNSSTGSRSYGAGGVSFGSGSTVHVSNSVIANNTGNANDINGQNQTFTVGFSLIGDANNLGIPGNGNNIIGVSPQLGALANNGGSVQTELPAPTSPLIGAADPNAHAEQTLPPTDARGAPRPTTTAADIGAVQLQLCGSIVEGQTCSCPSACVTACTCSAMGSCSGTVAEEGTACTVESMPGTCSAGTCHPAVSTTGTTTGGGSTGGTTTTGTTGGGSTTGTTGGGTTSGSTTGTRSGATTSSGSTTTSKKSGCAASPLDGAAPLALTWMVGLLGRVVRRKRR